MYQVIEYNDYRKENYIHLHGFTSDLEKAKQKAKEILEKASSKDREDCLCQIYELEKDHRNDYVALSNPRKDIVQYTYRYIEFPKLLHKTVRELYVEILEEKVPKSISPDEIITKDVFRDLLDRKLLSGYLNFLQEDTNDICITMTTTIAAVVKCDEL